MRSFMKYFVPVIIALAILGLSFELVTNPFGLFSNILMTIGFIALFFLIFKWVMAKRSGSSLFSSQSGPTRAQLKKAKETSRRQTTKSTSPFTRKQSLMKRKDEKTRAKKKSTSPLSKKRREHNLTVIEGKKAKKKNRALF